MVLVLWSGSKFQENGFQALEMLPARNKGARGTIEVAEPGFHCICLIMHIKPHIFLSKFDCRNQKINLCYSGHVFKILGLSDKK
jgi:hypothetical protein